MPRRRAAHETKKTAKTATGRFRLGQTACLALSVDGAHARCAAHQNNAGKEPKRARKTRRERSLSAPPLPVSPAPHDWSHSKL